MKNDSLRGELRGLLADVKVVSSTEYSFRDQRYNIFSSFAQSEEQSQPVARYFATSLGGLIYSIYHCRQTQSTFAGIGEGAFANFYDARGFIESLSAANLGRGTLEPGWAVRGIESNGVLAVTKNGLTLWTSPHLFALEAGQGVEIGKVGSISIGKESRAMLPGFYLANGDALVDDDSRVQKSTTVRLYWNIDSSVAVSLMEQVTGELNKAAIPFRFKTVSNPSQYVRADAAVLYLNRRHLEASKGPLSRIYGRVKGPGLKPATPLFAKRLAPGVALAEDPNNGESFGTNRSRILAEAIYSAYEKGVSGFDQELPEVERHFGECGLTLDTAYLSQGSRDDYDAALKGVFG